MSGKSLLVWFLFLLFSPCRSFIFGDFDYLVKFNAGPGLIDNNSPVVNQELNTFSLTSTYDDGTPSSTMGPGLTYLMWGFSGEVIYDQFGFILEYNQKILSENISGGDYTADGVDDNGNTTYSGGSSYNDNFMTVNGFYTGINYHILLFPDDPGYTDWWKAGGVSFFFGLNAGLLSGSISPNAVSNDYQGLPQLNVNLTGYSFCPDMGIDFIWGVVNSSLTVSYYLDNYTAGENLVYFYNYFGKNFSIDYLAFEFSIGIAFPPSSLPQAAPPVDYQAAPDDDSGDSYNAENDNQPNTVENPSKENDLDFNIRNRNRK